MTIIFYVIREFGCYIHMPFYIIDLSMAHPVFWLCAEEFSCDIEPDGRIHIKGVTTTGEKIVCKNSRIFRMQTQNLCPPGHFSITFQLPGPVDHKQFSGHFGNDGMLEGIVKKRWSKAVWNRGWSHWLGPFTEWGPFDLRLPWGQEGRVGISWLAESDTLTWWPEICTEEALPLSLYYNVL